MVFIGLYWTTHNFPNLQFFLAQHLCFLGLCWDAVNVSVYLSSDKLLEVQQLLQTQPVAVCQVMSFFGKTISCAKDMHNFIDCVVSFRMTY